MSKHFNEAVEGDDGGLVICRGCKASGTYAALPSGECPTPYKPDSVLLNESLAREQALQQRLTAADQQTDDLRAELAANPKPDPVLCKFYDVTDWPGLVRELVGHVAQLQESAKRNVKPWEDTFPPTLLPAYIERVNAANAAVQPQDVPVEWGAPKTVRQLIRQLETLDQDLRPLSMLRVPASVFEDGKERVRATHLSFSHERVDGQWLAPFKSGGEKVVAFWCRMEQPAPVAVVLPDQKTVSALVTKAARQADLTNGANYYTAAELAAEAVIDEVTRLNPSL